MIKLYCSKTYPQHWIAYAPDAGWLIFPKTDNGWEQRKPARGLDPIHLRQVPLEMAARSGMNQPQYQEVA
jgi:hypothetical protein